MSALRVDLNKMLDKTSFISIGLALAIFSGIFVFGISQERRVSEMETILRLQQPQIEELRREVKENREILISIKEVNKRLDRIEKKLKID